MIVYNYTIYHNMAKQNKQENSKKYQHKFLIKKDFLLFTTYSALKSKSSITVFGIYY
jgi:hypothetical protein